MILNSKEEETAWRRVQIEAFLARISEVELCIESRLRETNVKSAEAKEFYDQQEKDITALFDSIMCALRDAQERLHHIVLDNIQSSQGHYATIWNRFDRIKYDVQFIRQDIVSNYNEILENVEHQPFTFILQRYFTQLDDFQTDIDQLTESHPALHPPPELMQKVLKVDELLSDLHAMPGPPPPATPDTPLITSINTAAEVLARSITPTPSLMPSELLKPTKARDVISQSQIDKTGRNRSETSVGSAKSLPPKVALTSEILQANPATVSFSNKEHFDKALKGTQPPTGQVLQVKSPSFMNHQPVHVMSPGRQQPGSTKRMKPYMFLSDRKGSSSDAVADDVNSSDCKQKYLTLLEKVVTNQNNHNAFYANLIRTKLSREKKKEDPLFIA
jgi:hypothetical protein